jgi:hypothetical protein
VKLLLVILLVSAHAYAADDQSYNDSEISAEAIWYDNGDMDVNDLMQLVFHAVGPGGPGQQRLMSGKVLLWEPCTAEMISPRYQAGFVPTPRGWYRNPNYVVQPGGKKCARN